MTRTIAMRMDRRWARDLYEYTESNHMWRDKRRPVKVEKKCRGSGVSVRLMPESFKVSRPRPLKRKSMNVCLCCFLAFDGTHRAF